MLAKLWKLARRHKNKKRQRRAALGVESLESRMLLDGNGLLFHFNFAPNTPQIVKDAAVAAGSIWSSQLSDDVTVNTDFSFTPVTAYRATSTSVQLDESYSIFRSLLVDDATTSDDTAATSNLPAGSSVGLYMNQTSDSPHGDTSLTPYVDNNNSTNNTQVRVNRAVAKSVGLVSPRSTSVDGTITISNIFVWDYDRSDGVSPGKNDLVGAIAHELGHVLGFHSEIDLVDDSPGESSNFYRPGPLDLFRFSTASTAAGVRDLSSDARDKYFSLNGGTTKLASFSTGANGDGAQPSHWKNGQDLGMMDPAKALGERSQVSVLDLRALDVIGWDRLPFSTNSGNRFDVNDDGFVSPSDALAVINRIIQIADGIPETPTNHVYYVDVNEDGKLSPVDALQVINVLIGAASPEGEAFSSVNWGDVGFGRFDGVSVQNGDLFEFQTTLTGSATVQAFFSHAGGNVNLEVFTADNLFSPLATASSTTNNERIDFFAVAGETYYVRASGANPDVDFVVANQVSFNGSVVDVLGTSGVDTFTFVAGANYVVTANGVDYTYPSASVSQVAFHGGGGTDSITVTGSASRDTAYLYPKSMTVYGTGYQVTTSDVETQRIYSSGGSDYAYFYDSSGNDTFSGRKGAMSMNGSGYANEAYDFYSVYAYANAGGFDQTFFYDTSGNDTYLGAASYSYMYGSGYMHYASGFDYVYAYATLGGYDQAYFYDSSGYDYMYGRSNYAYVYGGGTLRFGQGFDAVYAYGYYGGTNVYDVSGVNYYFARYGSWQSV